MPRKILLLICSVMLTLCAFAQKDNPVAWTMSIKMTSATEGVLTIHASMEPGWHLYGTQLPEGGPQPTTIALSATKGVEFIGKLTPSVAPTKVNDQMFGMMLNWWAKPVDFTCKVSVKNAPKNWKIIANIENMACNDETCMPPSSTELTVLSVQSVKATKK